MDLPQIAIISAIRGGHRRNSLHLLLRPLSLTAPSILGEQNYLMSPICLSWMRQLMKPLSNDARKTGFITNLPRTVIIIASRGGRGRSVLARGRVHDPGVGIVRPLGSGNVRNRERNGEVAHVPEIRIKILRVRAAPLIADPARSCLEWVTETFDRLRDRLCPC